MKELDIPGVSFAIINDGKVAYRNTFGYANKEEKIAVSDKTIFEAASLSKSVFAFFAMKYVEEGRLDLDKPLFEYLPYPDIEHDARYKKITARMVLSHRSGFPNWRENETDRKLKIKFDPGTGYEYSGEGYQYLAKVLKHLDNTDWMGLENSFQNMVAKPLDMKHTVFVPNSYIMKKKAEPYNKNGKRVDWKNSYWYKKDKDKFVAPSSMHTESLDFSKWMIAIMNKELLSLESYDELLKHHSKTATTSTGMNIYYTLGFLNPDGKYSTTYIHDGNNEGFTSWFLIDTEKDWGYVLFTNSDNGGGLGNNLWNYLEKEKY
nr:serine hydrolase domain-containing protein [Allomuricauda parva]